MKIIRNIFIGVLTLFVVLIGIIQYVSISALDTLIEQAESETRPLSRWHTTASDLTVNDNDLVNVIFVGNNWQGSITVIALDGYRKIGVIDGIPDKLERLKEVRSQFIERMLYIGIRELVGEGNDQFVDDMYSSNDGRKIIVSRPSFADVVAIDSLTGEVVWRFPVAGFRSDHMAISPDGKYVAVSASTGDLVHIIDVETGVEHAQFPSGDSPHENIYSKDGKHLFHASIGNVFSPLDFDGGGLLKGKRVVQVVETTNYTIVEKFDMRDKLDAVGLEHISPAVRPMAHTSDEEYFYFQLSFLHGFVEYHLPTGKITRKIDLPKVTTAPKTKYVNDSAHHGIAISADDKTLCVAGTMDDYVAIVDIQSEQYQILDGLGKKPYWVVTDKTGSHCFVSWSETDQVSVISYQDAAEVARIDVGDHPQRVREGVLVFPK
ncbi:serine/threonine protein kinase [Thalassotalea sp. HSM 43]|uniref:YncE family protein n=1 Tax=Thalassotalea sp. HSM 43 TaxID=2552945 RepID=UPI00108206C2|nr:serine/threonine protein kinase [Thalassotalea sp. HSM 43]QBY04282.1 serine/threonine protein kinase [Thalassotalea sp. HSM 43]